MKNRLLAMDVWAVRDLGIDGWLEAEPVPVSDEEGRQLVRAGDRAFVNALASSPTSPPDVVLASYKTVVESIQFLHANLLADRAENAGRHPVDSGRSELLKCVNSVRSETPYTPAPLFPGTAFGQRILAMAKGMVRDIKAKRVPRGTLAGVLGWPEMVSWGYPGRYQREYAKRSAATLSIIHPVAWTPNVRLTSGKSSDFGSVITSFLHSLAADLEDMGIRFSARVFEHMNQLWTHRLVETEAAIRDLEDRIPKGSSTVLATSLGTAGMKCFSTAARRRGHRVVGFVHGHLGLTKIPMKALNELSQCDVYVTPTARSRELYQRLYDDLPVPRARPTAIDSLDESEGSDSLLVAGCHHRVPVRDIMFVEFPLAPFRYQTTNTFWMYQLRLQIRLSQALRSLGYRTTMKRHPDRLAESEGLYSDFFDRTITAPFEQVYREADAFLFCDIASTTFPFALASDYPVFVLEHTLQDVWEDERNALRERCVVLPNPRNGRATFDPQTLSTIMNAATRSR